MAVTSPQKKGECKMRKWEEFDKFEGVINKYMPASGEGETMASQAVTAVNKLIYKWYNDGDVYDNTNYLDGWCNDLSSYANWLYNYLGAYFLDMVWMAESGDDYEEILYQLAEFVLDEDYLEGLKQKEKKGSIYDCEGFFKFIEDDDDDEDW